MSYKVVYESAYSGAMNNCDDDGDGNWDVVCNEENKDEESWHGYIWRKENEWATRKPAEYPEVTISSFTETGQEELSIIIPKQASWINSTPHSECHTGWTTHSSHPFWNTVSQTTMILAWHIATSIKYGTPTTGAFRIVNPELPPRHVWDLYSNQVVPYWMKDAEWKRPWPISHAWVDKKDRTTVWMPINGYEWPVPIPKDADLDLIHIEMLNLRHKYAWLDSSLFETGGRTEGGLACRRSGGWTCPPLDMCIESGGDLESDRSWFRHAWTLQEVGILREIAGDTPDGPLHAKGKDGEYATELLTRFHKQLRDACHWFLLDEVLAEMRTRVSMNPVDKIAGLASLVLSRWIPAYSESASLEHAWTALVDSMDVWHRAQLFILCAEPGDAGPKWRPSWHQAMTKPLFPYLTFKEVDRDETGGVDWCVMRCVEGFMWGWAVVEEDDRHGEFIVKHDDGIKQFKITAAHTYPIPDNTYTLIFYSCFHRNESDKGLNVCIVGRSLPEGRFEKVSVVETWDMGLQDITEIRQYILI
ncbi:hypothetical protein IW261DRAFT_1659643 [Armillaria novae-zelandiae]|uniref:Heterokaryon incompatibility domain-containing protein n=1 Tax=Armillaria novae-zelandiae TaxID=153914 RepID=A0AA39NWT3_9AGAR|nr:hypothetical protein IW261DRAFT_1659643 [Armillaria novae-zelandiae]